MNKFKFLKVFMVALVAFAALGCGSSSTNDFAGDWGITGFTNEDTVLTDSSASLVVNLGFHSNYNGNGAEFMAFNPTYADLSEFGYRVVVESPLLGNTPPQPNAEGQIDFSNAALGTYTVYLLEGDGEENAIDSFRVTNYNGVKFTNENETFQEDDAEAQVTLGFTGAISPQALISAGYTIWVSDEEEDENITTEVSTNGPVLDFSDKVPGSYTVWLGSEDGSSNFDSFVITIEAAVIDQ